MNLRQKGWPRSATSTTLFLVLLLFAGCRSESELPRIDGTAPETVISSTPPFPTKEPERYRATRTITVVTGGESLVTTTSIARDGAMRRYESDTASKKVAYLDVPEGRFVLLVDDKVYADLETGSDLPSSQDEEISPERLLHGDASQTSYEKIGTETVAGRKTNKYRVLVNSSSSGNVTLSETLIWIDETLNMPIRSETRSPDLTRTTMELSNIDLDVDKGVFQVPEDYKKIAFDELRKRLINPD
jgi:outer membrane lipoprotein-sorting protein